MVQLVNDFAEGTNGTALTTGNTAGSGENAFDVVSAGAGTTLAFSNTAVAHGTLAAQVATGGTAAGAYMGWSTSLGAQAVHYGRIYVNVSGTPAASDAFVQFQSGSGVFAGGLQLTTGRQVAIQLTSLAIQATMSTVLAVGTWYRIEWKLVSSASGAGQVTVSLYSGDAATATETYTSAATLTIGGAATDAVLVGWTGAHAGQPAVYVDDVALSTTGPLGPWSGPSVTSPVIEVSSFGTFPGVNPGDMISTVTVAVTEHQSSTTQPPCTFELWDYSGGTPAQIGSTQNGTASTSPSNVSSAVFTGVTYPMLATLRVRVYGHSTATGQSESVDSVSLLVSAVPPETSPFLEVSAFGTFAGVHPGDTINSVTVTVTEHQSSIAQPPCTFELWDYSGTPAQIGTTQTGTASTSAGNASTATFTGVTYPMLATLRVRVYGHGSAAGQVESVDSVSLSVSATPGTGGTATPATLAVTTARPAPVVTGGNVTAAPATLAVTTAEPVPAVTGGNVVVTPATLAVTTAVPRPVVTVPVFVPTYFPAVVLGIKVELQIAGNWTDITRWAYQRNPLQITGMGRADWTSTMQASQLTMTLNNRDGRFTPKNSAGAYWPNITRNVPVRVSVTTKSSTGVTYSGFRFFGEVTEWPPRWDPSGHDVTVEVVASGIWRRLSQLQTTLGSAFRRYNVNTAAATGMQAYWPCEDGTGSGQLVPYGPPAANAVQQFVTGQAGLSLTANSDFSGSDAICVLNAAAITATVPAGGVASNNVTRFVISVPAAGDSASGTTNWNLIEIDSGGTVAKFEVYLNATGTLLMQLRNSAGTVIASGVTTTNVKGVPYLVSCELTPSGGSVAFALRIIKQNAGGITESMLGTVGGLVGAVSKVVVSRAFALNDTAFGHLSVSYGAPTSLVQAAGALAGYIGETAMDRFTRLCGEMGIATETIGTAASTAPLGPQVDDTLANVLQSIEDTDCGLLYESRSQFGLGYRSNASMANQAAAVVLNYTAPVLDSSLAPVYDDQLTRNNVTVSNWTGYTQQAILTTGPMSVLNPPAGVGNGYAYQRAVTAAADSQLPGIANFLLNLGSADEIRFPVITVKMVRTQAAPLLAAIPALRIGDYLQITNPPPFLPQTTIRQLAWGYAETLNAKEWTFSFNTVPESPWEVGFSPGTIQTAQIPGGSPVTSQAPGSGFGSLANGSITPAMLNSGITIHTLGGNAVTISFTAPANPNTGDIWIAAATGLLSQWNGTAWIPFKFDGSVTIQGNTITAGQIAAGTIVASNIAAGTITAALLAAGIIVAGIVDATTITGSVVQTAAAAPCVIMDGTRDSIFGYNAATGLLFSLAGAGGTDFFGHTYPQGLYSQQMTLANQVVAPASFGNASVFYSSVTGRPRYLNSAGSDAVLERSSVNTAQFTVGNTATPGPISALMSIFPNEGEQSSEYEIECSGSAHFGTAANHNLDFRLFKDGSAYAPGGTQLNAMTLDNSIVGTGISIAYTVTFRVTYIGSSLANLEAVGFWRDQNATTLMASNTGTMGGNAQNLAWDPTISHTLEIRASWGTTQAGQTLTTYRTKMARRM